MEQTKPTEFRCPYCGRNLETDVVVSTAFSMKGQSTGTDPVTFTITKDIIHLCPDRSCPEPEEGCHVNILKKGETDFSRGATGTFKSVINAE